MKMWAVFDKDGLIQQVDEDEFCTWDLFKDGSRWRLRELALDVFIKLMKAEGYTCAPVVVMRESVYNQICELVAHQANYAIVPTHLNEFLKAGE